MKKRFLLIFILLISFFSVNAENYDNVKETQLKFTIGSYLNVIDSGNNPSLDRLEVFLKLYPREDFRQKIVDFKIKSNPKAETNLNNVVYYKWNVLTNRYEYGVDSNVIVKNVFNSMKSQVKFPFTNDLGIDEFLGETEFIDINEEIREKANEIITGESDYYVAVYKIGEWVRQNVKYDLSTLTAETVQKSSWVLKNRKGVCDEITNLFISMLRSVGIPAKFVTGTVYTEAVGGFGNHGWAEVYFPNIGWVPFDVTFGQYGWVDPTHLKLAETSDSGESSVDYKWLSSNIEIKPEHLRLDTKIKSNGEKYTGLVKVSVLPLEKMFKFGSYLPILVNVQNLQNYYLTTRISLTKGPSQVEGDNSKIVLLKPKEAKTVYWLMKLPGDLEKDLLYSSIIEVRETFGDKDVTSIAYSNDGKYYNLDDISNVVRGIEEEENKEFFFDLYIECDEDNNEYKTGEKVKIKCGFKNGGNTKLNGIKICFNNECALENFDINEKKEYFKEIDAIDSVIVTAGNNELIRKKVLKLNYIKIPKLLITKVRPEKVDYNVNTEVIFSLSSSIKAYNIEIDIKGYKSLYIDELDGEKEISLNINSKNLMNGLRMDIKYKDEKGNEYSYDWNYPFVVEKVPWYVKILDVVGF